MSISTTPPPSAPKKKGMGCLGCGCLVLALLVILFAALVAGTFYFGYEKIVGLTSTTPASIPSFNGGDDVYNSAQQKLTAFDHDVKNHQAATIRLNADEINSLIAHNPNLTANNAHLFVTMTNDQAQVQGGIPTDVIAQGIMKGRYLNFDTTFGLGFNSDTRSVNLELHRMQVGDQTLPQDALPALQAEFTPLLNLQLQKYPDAREFLKQVKSLQIKDGELVIETQ